MAMVQLVFVGSPLLDITAKCDQSTLDKYGLKRDDGVKASERHDLLFQQLINDINSQLSSGGSAQNSARVAKWIAGDKAQVSFLGCTGNDPYDKWLRDKLTSDGVEPLYIQHPELKTGICACLISGEDKRSMITRHEAAATLSAKHLEINTIQERVSRADYVYVEGYVIAHSFDIVLALASKYSSTQVFSLSLSAEYICREHVSELLQVLPNIDVLFSNEAELKAFAAALGVPRAITVEECIAAVRRAKSRSSNSSMIIIITRGADPVVLNDEANNFRYFEVPSDISMVDTVGCGDALAGAFLAAYALTKNLDISVRAGIRAATEIAQVKACRMPSFKIFDANTLLLL